MAEAVAELVGVTKRYGANVALRSVALRLDRGEAVGYLGPNGAGKTTTLRLLAGLSRPDEGTVRLLGGDPRARPSPLGRVGALIETPGLLPYLTGRDVLGYAAAAKGLPLRDRPTEGARWSERLGVASALDRPLGTLSTGVTRRLLLVGALLGDPDLLLLDEPTLGLDPAARLDLRSVLRDLRRDGRTILLSTHLLEDVRAVCDRVVFLRDGTIVGDERVALGPALADGGALRPLRLRFAGEVDPAVLEGALAAGERLVRRSRDALEIVVRDSDQRQKELLAALVRAGAPLLELSSGESDLEARYLEAVGREAAP